MPANWDGGTGTGTDNLWTVVAAPVPFKLLTGANYQASSTACGLQFNCEKTTTATITTTNSFDFAGTAATVQFYVEMVNATASDSVTLQTSTNDSTFTSCVATPGTKNSNGFTPYTCSLSSSQLVNGVYLRFLFSGTGSGTAGDFIDLDQITVSVTGTTAVTVPMSAGSNGVYSASIPAETAGTNISYYISATDSVGLTTTAPATAPAAMYSYTVQTTKATSLVFDNGPASGNYGGTTSLAATLTASGTPLANEIIVFSFNGSSVGTATTNSSGIATLANASLSGITVGFYTSYVGAAFNGDFGNYYAPASPARKT